MNFIYNIILFKAIFLLKFIALFNSKIRLFIAGRKESFNKLSSIKKHDKTIWFHTASLGEFEQARPIIEQVKKQYTKHKIVLTFFSPSGYEIRKNYPSADVICYLPLDTPKNAEKFVEKVHPELAVFVKYEFWPNLLNALKRKEINTILVSGIFRKNQVFFKFYGKWMQKSLRAFHHFFVQDKSSKKILEALQFNNVTISGDTRFDRVHRILQQDNSLDFVADFINNQYTVVAGSTWKEDEKLLVNYVNNTASEKEKFIIAPHNINEKEIEILKKSIHKNVILYSNIKGKNLKDYQVLIVDAIGFLTKIYSYADVAYVGGGLATGLHNVLEPATFGIPVIFGGNKYKKFKEATDLILLNGCKIVKTQQEFSTIFARLFLNKTLRNKMGKINKKYVEENVGATQIISNYINNNL